jgi:dTDP-glucose pyrophosphorylase
MTRADTDVLGVILAAGKGTRIEPFSERHPKPILPVLGKPLLQHQIECLRDIGVRRIIIVIGHLGFAIVRELGDGRQLGVEIEYVDQGQTLGIAHAVGKLERVIDRPFMLFLGDIFFVHQDLGSMLTMLGRDDVRGVLAVKDEPSTEAIQRNFVVIEDARASSAASSRSPLSHDAREGLRPLPLRSDFFDAVRRTPRTAMRDEYEITDAIQIFIDDGHRVRTARVVREDLNLSEPADLLDINLRLLGEANLIGAASRFRRDARSSAV